MIISRNYAVEAVICGHPAPTASYNSERKSHSFANLDLNDTGGVVTVMQNVLIQ